MKAKLYIFSLLLIFLLVGGTNEIFAQVGTARTPVLDSPTTNQIGVSKIPLLEWHTTGPGSDAPTSWDIDVSVNSDLSVPIVTVSGASTADSSYQIGTTLTDGTKYYWRIKANGTTPSSAVDSFTVAVPHLSTPSYQATQVVNTPTLSWFMNVGTADYNFRVQVSKNDITFTPVNIVVDQSNLVSITNYTVASGVLEDGVDYYWRVSNHNGADSTWSAIWKFGTAGTTPTTTGPTLNTPVDNADYVTSEPLFNWYYPQLVNTDYEIQIAYSTNATFTAPIREDTTISSPQLTPLLSYTGNHLRSGETYIWRVRAENTSNPGSWGLWSSTFTFSTTGGISIGGTPNLTVPVNGQTWVSTTPTLGWWYQTTGHTKYQYEVSDASAVDGNGNFTGTIVDSATISATSASLAALTANQTYYWHVRACADDSVTAPNTYRTTAYSSTWSFTTTQNTAWPQAGLSAPADGDQYVSPNPTFSWWYVTDGAPTYELQVDTSSSFTSPVIDATGLATTSYTATGVLLTGTKYYWRVMASTATSWSDVYSFTTTGPVVDINSYNWYVDVTNGNDAFAGTLAAPFKTITHALGVAVSGQSILVFPGSYSGEGALSIPAGLTLTGINQPTLLSVTVTGSGVILNGFKVTGSAGAGITVNNSVDNLYLNNIAESAATTDGLNVTGGTNTNLTVTNSSFNLNPSNGVNLSGVTTINFSGVTASSNTGNGFNFDNVSSGTLIFLTANSNVIGLSATDVSSLSFGSGTYNSNSTNGVKFNASTADITGLSFGGSVDILNNSGPGLYLTTSAAQSITNPSFSGTIADSGNTTAQLVIEGGVSGASFTGLNIGGTSGGFGVEIVGLGTPGVQPSGVTINNSAFAGFNGSSANSAIILASDATGAPAQYTSNNVDAQNNQWVGETSTAFIDARIWDSNDNASLGTVDYTGYTAKITSPIAIVGSPTTLSGARVSVPVSLQGTSLINGVKGTLQGAFKFDASKLKFTSATTGSGTILNTSNWNVVFYKANDNEVHFTASGYNPMNQSGQLFKLNFDVLDKTGGSGNVQALNSSWSVDGAASALRLQNGDISYKAAPAVSTIAGDATLDAVVDINDLYAVEQDINGVAKLDPQGSINAKVNGYQNLSVKDMADLFHYLNFKTWSGNISSGTGTFTFGNVKKANSGLLTLPLTFSGTNNIQSIEVKFTYDANLIDFQSFTNLISGSGAFEDAIQVSPGVAKFTYIPVNPANGDFVPGNVMLRLKNNSATNVEINTSYSINGADYQNGPVYNIGSTTDVAKTETLPTDFKVWQNYPNPFNPTTTIQYALPQASRVTIKVYNILGQEIRTLINADRNAGTYSVQWNGDNSFGAKVSSGVYIYRVVAGNFVRTMKMMLLK